MKYSFLSLVMYLTLSIHGQTPRLDTLTAKTNLKTYADKMKQSLLEGDYATFTNYVHPQVAKMAGGKDKLIELTKESYKILEIQGYKIANVTFDTPAKIINSSSNLQAVVQENLTLQKKKGHLVAKSYLLAVSSDMGITWYFIDTSGKTLDQMRTVFPFLSTQLIIPKKEQPIFYRD